MRGHTSGRGQPGLPRWPLLRVAVSLICRPGKPGCCHAAWRPRWNHGTAAILCSSRCQACVSSWNGAEGLNSPRLLFQRVGVALALIARLMWRCSLCETQHHPHPQRESAGKDSASELLKHRPSLEKMFQNQAPAARSRDQSIKAGRGIFFDQ